MNCEARPLVSVAIVSWNTRELLRACLASLPYASARVGIEAIVVDNASTDGSAEMVRQEYPEVVLLENATNAGFTRATNQAIEEASGELVFLLNSDAAVREGCIERLVEVAFSDETMGAVAPKLVNPDGSTQPSAGQFPRMWHRAFPGRFERRYQAQLGRRLSSSATGWAEIDWLAGAAVLLRRGTLEQIGLLDERFFMWYEDLDFCRRLQRAGLRRVLVDDAVVVHHGRESARQVDDLTLQEQMFDSEYTYLRLHAGRTATWMAFALRVAKAAARRIIGGAEARAEAAFRLGYHRKNFRRFCLGSWSRELPQDTSSP